MMPMIPSTIGARAREAGWEIYLQPTAVVTHARGSTATPFQTRAWSIRNMLLFARLLTRPCSLRRARSIGSSARRS